MVRTPEGASAQPFLPSPPPPQPRAASACARAATGADQRGVPVARGLG